MEKAQDILQNTEGSEVENKSLSDISASMNRPYRWVISEVFF